MGKSHRDNHNARIKRGKVAFRKKAERRKQQPKCNICGSKCREYKLRNGICPKCIERSDGQKGELNE